MEEMINQIQSAAMEEIEDIAKYKNMSELAEGHVKGILRDIAHDESTHARILIMTLKKYGKLTDELARAWEECQPI